MNSTKSRLAELVLEEKLCASIDNVSGTTKEYEHSYLSRVYEPIFRNLDYQIRNLLEIGVAKGGSIELWRRSNFVEKITGIDPNPEFQEFNKYRDWSELNLIWDDAYRRRVYKNVGREFSLIIDDGPHTYWSQKISLRKYPLTLALGGFYILEDIDNVEEVLKTYFFSIPRKLRECVHLFDLREHALNKQFSVALVVHVCQSENTDCSFRLMQHDGTRIIYDKKSAFLMKPLLLIENCFDYLYRVFFNGVKFKFTSIATSLIQKVTWWHPK